MCFCLLATSAGSWGKGNEMTKPPQNGACKGKPTRWWFPNANNRDTAKERQEAREGASKAIQICNSCAIREECLAYSLEWEPVGIWGGIPESHREKMRRRMGIRILRPTLADVLGYPSRV